MLFEQALANCVAGALHELLTTDPAAAEALVSHRVPVSEAVAAHPIFGQFLVHSPEGPRLGILGVVNALFADSGLRVVSCRDDGQDMKLVGFAVMEMETPEAPCPT